MLFVLQSACKTKYLIDFLMNLKMRNFPFYQIHLEIDSVNEAKIWGDA